MLSNSKFKFIIVIIPYGMCARSRARAHTHTHTHTRLPRSCVIHRDIIQMHRVMCVVSVV